MIKTLEIKNFKSIKQLKLDCKRVNVFIGEPNTGKSNLLETLGLFSFCYYTRFGYNLRSFVRHERVSNLFYDEDLNDTVEIRLDNGALLGTEILRIGFKGGRFDGEVIIIQNLAQPATVRESSRLVSLHGDISNLQAGGPRVADEPPSYWEDLCRFKFYRFAVRESFGKPDTAFLLPPSGDNLSSLLLTRKELRAIAGKLFSPSGFKLGVRPQENRLELRKEVEDITISYPYSLASETLQSLVFYMAAMLPNKESTIVRTSVLAFEEPESHAFPYHTKYLAEAIALDKNRNQYFISTHSPYFLEPLVEKTPKAEIGVFITYFKDYQTRVKALSQQEIEEALETDIFLNLERFIKE